MKIRKFGEIVYIDEATSAVDPATDQLIQQTVMHTYLLLIYLHLNCDFIRILIIVVLLFSE